MKIGMGFLQNSFYLNTSECTLLKNVGRVWKRLGHEVYYINQKQKERMGADFIYENLDLLPFVKTKEEVGKVDILFEMFDFNLMSRYSCEADIKTGVFVWALTPLPKKEMLRLQDFRKPIFVTGGTSWADASSYMDVELFVSGVDKKIFYPPPLKNKEAKTRFLWVGWTNYASGIDILLEGFKRAFSASDQVSLTLVDPKGKARKLAQEILPSGYDVQFVETGVCQKQLAEIYRTHDALVMPIRFHGVCHPIGEAMSCGLPVITTDWTGPADYAFEDEVWFIKHTVEEVSLALKKLRSKYGKLIADLRGIDKFPAEMPYLWAKPNVDHLVQLLQDVHEGKYQEETIQKALTRTKGFDWKEIAKYMLKGIENAK